MPVLLFQTLWAFNTCSCLSSNIFYVLHSGLVFILHEQGCSKSERHLSVINCIGQSSFQQAFSSRSSAVFSQWTLTDRDQCQLSPGASLGISSLLCLPHSVSQKCSSTQTQGHTWIGQTNGKREIESAQQPAVWPDWEVLWCITVRPGASFGTPSPHMSLYRGSPAHLSRGPAVTTLMPKITSVNGGDAEGTDQ